MKQYIKFCNKKGLKASRFSSLQAYKKPEMKKVLISTDDNWCGNFTGDKMELSLISRENSWAVLGSGTDDFILEREFISFSEAFMIFNALSKLDKINHSDLNKLGFEQY